MFLLVSSSFWDVGVDMEAFLLLPRLVVNSFLRASGVAGLSMLGSKGLQFCAGLAGKAMSGTGESRLDSQINVTHLGAESGMLKISSQLQEGHAGGVAQWWNICLARARPWGPFPAL